MKTVPALAAAVLVALVQVGCAIPSAPQGSPSGQSSPTPIALNPAESKAADLRVSFDLLLGEHVIVVAKASASAARSQPAFPGYARLLTANGGALGDLMRSAFGDTAGAEFDQVWSMQNSYLVDYAIGLVTHNQSKSNGAMSGLINGFVPQFSQLVTTLTKLPLNATTKLVTQQLLETKAMIDEQIAQTYPKMYADLRTVYAQTSQLGDALVPRIAQMFPDKFPGSTSNQALNLRVSMNGLLQEHLYLATMATSAAAGGRAAELAAATNALAENARAIGSLLGGLFGDTVASQFGRIWAAKDTAMIGYVSAARGTVNQVALNQVHDVFVTQFSGFVQDVTGLATGTFRPVIASQVDATVIVLDDQRSRSVTTLAADDRSADISMESVADLITAAIVTKLSARFG